MATYSLPPRTWAMIIIGTMVFLIFVNQSQQTIPQDAFSAHLPSGVQRHFNNIVSQRPITSVEDGRSSSKIRAAPGFESAAPSCRITDMIDDPLVKEYGQTNIRLSRSYEASGTRVRKVLEKALKGEKIKIGVVGGSVSAGHAIRLPLTPDNYMYMRIQRWFQETFPEVKHELDLSAAMPATTNLYFSYCLMEHLPEDVDIVFVELDINANPRGDESLLSTEYVLRTALALPKQPAVIYLSIFALSFDDMVHGWLGSLPSSQWLDIPHLNIRNFMLPHVFKHPEQHQELFIDWASNFDPRHINAKAHTVMGDMAIAYLREQLCLVQREVPLELPHNKVWPSEDITASTPRLDILSHWSETESLPDFHPRCRSIISAYDPLIPLENKGFHNVTRNDKISYEATEIGSQITFEFSTAQGVAGFWFWHTWDEKFASVDCWIDGDQSPQKVRHIDAHDPNFTAPVFDWTRNIWEDLEPGDHNMTCRTVEGLKGGNIFRISATVTR